MEAHAINIFDLPQRVLRDVRATTVILDHESLVFQVQESFAESILRDAQLPGYSPLDDPVTGQKLVIKDHVEQVSCYLLTKAAALYRLRHLRCR